jgi:hypothetical protein
VRRSAAIAALVIAVLVSACGESAAPPAVGEAFAARADAVCQAALESKQKWSSFPVPNFNPAQPDPKAFPKVAVWLEEQVAPTFQAWLDGLTTLGPPPTAQNDWNNVLGAVAKIVQGNADEITTAKAGDAKGFVAARDKLVEIQPVLVQATADAGVPKCADVHKS